MATNPAPDADTQPPATLSPALTTGVPALDELIHDVRIGDNLVIIADDRDALDAVRRAYQAATADWLAGLDTDGDETLEDLLARFAAADTAAGREAHYLVDSLTAVHERWGSDAALELFLTVCPRLYRRGSIALWLLDGRRHDDDFLGRIAEITQVVVRLTSTPDGIDAEVVVAAGRPPTTVGRRRRLRLRDGSFVAEGEVLAGRPRLGELIRQLRTATGVGQAELARRVGISPSALSQVERGVRGLAADTLIRIWDELGVPFGPDDTVPHGYRIRRRGAHQVTRLAPGVTGRQVIDDASLGHCWELEFVAGAVGDRPLFKGKLTEAVLVQRGVLELRIGGNTETLQEGDSLIAPQAVVEAWGSPGTGATVLWYLLR